MRKKLLMAGLIVSTLLFSMPVQAEELITDPIMATGSGGDVSGGDVSGDESADDFGGDDEASDSAGSEEDEITDLSGKMINLAFVIDTTGSMGYHISDVQKNLSDFVKYIDNTGAEFRISLIDYKDVTEGEETVVHKFNYSVWSGNADEIIEELESLAVEGGGDEEETVIDALGYILDDAVMTFNSDASKFSVVVTDAPYKIENTHGYTSMEEVIAGLVEKGIRVSVMTNSSFFDNYRQLTEETGGILCPIDNFTDTLKEYAESIIQTTAETEVNEEVKSVKSISVSGTEDIRPEYVYEYVVHFEPEDATDQGLYWYFSDESIAEIVLARGNKCHIRGLSEGTTTLTAVSRDGGYTYSKNITVSNSAETTDSYLSYDYSSISSILSNDEVKNIEYRIVDETYVSKDEQKEILSSIQGKDKSFTFAFADGEKQVKYTWTFVGTDIQDASVSVEFGIESYVSGTEALDKVDEDVTDATDIHFIHNGSLPGAATIEIPANNYQDGTSLNLYYYNSEERAFELMASGVNVENGYVAFPILHCSDYILTAQMLRNLVPTLSSTDDDDDKDTDKGVIESNDREITKSSDKAIAPNTGDDTDYAGLWYFMIFAFGSAISIRKSREQYR